MRIAIMQPYFLPYIGYFQLVHAVDRFVVYDDVNYIRRGWISRNRILGTTDEPAWLTLQTVGASRNKHICDIGVGQNRAKLLKTIQQRYARAPQFARVMPLLTDIFGNEEGNLARYLLSQLQSVCEFLNLKTRWQLSSQVSQDRTLKGQERIISICRSLGATSYVNAAGGRALYDGKAFATQGIDLLFVESRTPHYRQFADSFVPNLSIVDVLMFNDADSCARLLEDYALVG